MAEEIWTPEKKRWKHLELEFIPHEQTPKKKGLLDDDEIRIRITLCLSSSNLIDDNRIFAYYLFLMKKD